MQEENLIQLQKSVRSPRSAALAGILFSVLLIASMLLISGIAQVSPAEISTEWIETRADSVSLALRLVPFAGIAFFWFTGVIRDHIGDREDRFFATVFLGSGIASSSLPSFGLPPPGRYLVVFPWLQTSWPTMIFLSLALCL